MAERPKIDLGLTGYDELFMDDKECTENRLPKIHDIPLTEIDDFPGHPYQVRLDEDIDQLIQSVRSAESSRPSHCSKKMMAGMRSCPGIVERRRASWPGSKP